MWQRLAGFVLKYRLLLLVLLLAGTGVMGYFASKVQMSYDYVATIPHDNPKFFEYQDFKKRFGGDGNVLMLAVQTDKFFQADFFK